MSDHQEAKKSYGSDRAQLVYGLRPDGTLAHISEVQRGLACGCVCPACHGSLVARLKDDHQVPHFAHHGGEACGGGPETVLHLLAKEAFRTNPMMLLPERLSLDQRKQVTTKPGREVETEFRRLEYTDPKKIIPDLYIRVLGHDLFVEVAVTHFSDDIKIQRLREHHIPAVEVDLSQIPRDSTREAVSDAVLRSAPRHWLYHPGIEAAKAKQRVDEEKRHAELEKRQADAQARHEARVKELVHAYRTAPPHPLADEVPRLAELKAVGLAEHIDIAVSGIACFTVSPGVWQATVLAEVFHDRCLGNGVHKAVPITQHLEKAGLIRSPFRRVPGIVAGDAAIMESTFAPPWKAVDAYLAYLSDAGVLIRHGYSTTLARTFAEPWDALTLAEKNRTAVMHATVMGVERILAALPGNERNEMTSEVWLDSIHADSGLTYRAALKSDSEAPNIMAGIDVVVAMLEKHGPLPHGTVGLPIEGAIERHKAHMAKRAEETRKKRLQEAQRLRGVRSDRLCVDAEQALPAADLAPFLTTKFDELNGMTPLESAEDSEVGLNRARELLSGFARRLAREAQDAAERKLYREKITADARHQLAAEHHDAFLNGRDDDLGRMTPLSFVKDEITYRKALGKLSEWKREFGRQP